MNDEKTKDEILEDPNLFKTVNLDDPNSLNELNSEEDLKASNEEIIEGNKKMSEVFQEAQEILKDLPLGRRGKHQSKFTKKKINHKKRNKLERQRRKQAAKTRRKK